MPLTDTTDKRTDKRTCPVVRYGVSHINLTLEKLSFILLFFSHKRCKREAFCRDRSALQRR